MLSKKISLSIICLICLRLTGQETIEHHNVIDYEEMYVSILEIRDTLTRYSPNVETLDVIQELEWESIYLPDRNITKGFPDIYFQKFALILHSNFKIEQAGIYKFVLSSDDGSVIWIDDYEIVNNDGIHKMTTTANSIFLDVGDHHLKLFYFQLWPDKLGLMLETSFLGNKEEVASLPPALNISFDSNVFSLNDILKKTIDSWIAKLSAYSDIQLDIIGHTDNIGSEASNKTLGLNRAHSVEKYIQQRFSEKKFKIYTSSRGYNQPIDSNKDSEGRSLNRRVEIIARF